MNFKTVCIVVFIILFLSSSVYYKTGFFAPEGVDKQDIEKWEHNENGVMEGQEEFSIEGSKDHCWLLTHSYTSTPSEMKYLGSVLNEHFGEYVRAPRLLGHGMLPSELEGFSLSDWYNQIEGEYLDMKEECEGVSFIGSSIGGLIGMRLSEEHNLYSVYALNSFFNVPYNFYYIFKPEVYMEVFGPYFHYVKKNKTGRIADPEGKKKHFAYLNMPLKPMVDSKDFFLETKQDLAKIKEPMFIAHSIEDPVSSFEGVREAYKIISSKEKEFLEVSNSEHILLRDYDKWEIIEKIIDFEESLR